MRGRRISLAVGAIAAAAVLAVPAVAAAEVTVTLSGPLVLVTGSQANESVEISVSRSRALVTAEDGTKFASSTPIDDSSLGRGCEVGPTYVDCNPGSKPLDSIDVVGGGGNDELIVRARSRRASSFTYDIRTGDETSTAALMLGYEQGNGTQVRKAIRIDARIRGGAGNDKLGVYDGFRYSGEGWESTGKRRVMGGGGDDTIQGGRLLDTLMGGPGVDFIAGDGGNDVIFGGDGNDVLSGNDGADTLYGELGDDGLFGQAGNDRLFGHDGADTLIGSSGRDTLVGGGGVDGFSAGSHNDRVFANDGEADKSIACGSGTDRVRRDGVDPAPNGCEQ